MDSLRYYVALLAVASAPGVFLYWFSIHPFVGFWRKVGARPTVCIHVALIALLAVAVFLQREPILALDFGAQPILIGAAAVVLVISLVVRVQIHRVFKSRRLNGLSELAPDEFESRLVTTGIYAHVRHPRYGQMVLVSLACALFSNYLAVHVVFVLSVVWVWLLLPIEERELRTRFGDDYQRYAERVPRLIPRLRRRPGT